MLIATVLLTLFLSSCEQTDANTEPEISVSEDGYLVVDGNKTQYKVDLGKEDTITVDSDGYIVVNGNKTEYRGTICNHSYTEWHIHPSYIENCQEKPYFRACTKCGKIENRSEPFMSEHIYPDEYLNDSIYHWKKCINCNNTVEKEEHNVDDNHICSICSAIISATEGVIYDVSIDNNGFYYAMVIGYDGESTRVRIAEVYNGLPVSQIYYDAFSHNEKITEVIIPDSVLSIESGAFEGCSALKSIVIPYGVCSIGYGAFENCSALQSVVIGNRVSWIGGRTFYGCSALQDIVIPDSLTEVGQYAFEGCTQLITKYNNCKYVASRDNPYHVLIEPNNKNRSTYSIHEDTKIIANYAFSYCATLQSITIPDSVTSIGYCAFILCSNLQSVTIISNSVKMIKEGTFYGCSALQSIVIPDGVTYISKYAFYDCIRLSSIVIPNSVNEIGEYAFEYCQSLANVYYTGSKWDWNELKIQSCNYPLTKANKTYNYAAEEFK